ncbi:hypothetical protein ANO11243_067330 [Dothideomycetidae sp. 11243]|nr:hypothetical protein ANO11243_067330 [fungal sp. No.11243]
MAESGNGSAVELPTPLAETGVPVPSDSATRRPLSATDCDASPAKRRRCIDETDESAPAPPCASGTTAAAGPPGPATQAKVSHPPLEVLSRVFGDLPPRDIRACSRVSKSWSGAVEDFLHRTSAHSLLRYAAKHGERQAQQLALPAKVVWIENKDKEETLNAEHMSILQKMRYPKAQMLILVEDRLGPRSSLLDRDFEEGILRWTKRLRADLICLGLAFKPVKSNPKDLCDLIDALPHLIQVVLFPSLATMLTVEVMLALSRLPQLTKIHFLMKIEDNIVDEAIKVGGDALFAHAKSLGLHGSGVAIERLIRQCTGLQELDMTVNLEDIWRLGALDRFVELQKLIINTDDPLPYHDDRLLTLSRLPNLCHLKITCAGWRSLPRRQLAHTIEEQEYLSFRRKFSHIKDRQFRLADIPEGYGGDSDRG